MLVCHYAIRHATDVYADTPPLLAMPAPLRCRYATLYTRHAMMRHGFYDEPRAVTRLRAIHADAAI